MKLYCVTKNSGPSWTTDPLTMVYLGTSSQEAYEAVGNFDRYQRTPDDFPQEHLDLYTALPRGTEFELIEYYMADGWWYTIVLFELTESEMA